METSPDRKKAISSSSSGRASKGKRDSSTPAAGNNAAASSASECVVILRIKILYFTLRVTTVKVHATIGTGMRSCRPISPICREEGSPRHDDDDGRRRVRQVQQGVQEALEEGRRREGGVGGRKRQVAVSWRAHRRSVGLATQPLSRLKERPRLLGLSFGSYFQPSRSRSSPG